MVGEVLRAYKKGDFERSRLYSAEFSHEYRKALKEHEYKIEDGDKGTKSIRFKKEVTPSSYNTEREILHITSKKDIKRVDEEVKSKEGIKTRLEQKTIEQGELRDRDHERYIEKETIEQKPSIYIWFLYTC